MANKQPSSRTWGLIIFGVLFLCSLIGKKSDSTRRSSYNHSSSPRPVEVSSPPSTPPVSTLPRVETLPRIETFPPDVPVATPLAVTTPSPLVSRGTGGKFAYRPKTVKLVEDVAMPIIQGGTVVGTQNVPSGTVVTLSSINRDKVVVEYNGGAKEISATATDLVEQMVDAANR